MCTKFDIYFFHFLNIWILVAIQTWAVFQFYHMITRLNVKGNGRGHLGHDRMVVGFITTNECNQCLSPLTLWVRIPFRRGVFNTTLCDKVRQWLAAGWWFPLVSSTNKTGRHAITEILLKMALNIIILQRKWKFPEGHQLIYVKLSNIYKLVIMFYIVWWNKEFYCLL